MNFLRTNGRVSISIFFRHSNPFRLAAVCLGLLCAGQRAVVAVEGFSSQRAATVEFAKLEQTVRAELEMTGIPGAAVAIVKGTNVVFAKGFGLASIETRAPVTPDMLFRLGSTTKMFTCAALVSLAESGRLDLRAPIGNCISNLQPEIARLTPHELMTHTAGMRDRTPMYGPQDESALLAEVRTWNGDQLFAKPGEKYQYSNPGYWLAGAVAESVAEKPFADLLNDSLFQPLGMSRTTFRPTLAMTYPMALGHERNGDGVRVVRPFANNAASWPAGSIFSSVEDISRFLIAFLNDGALDGKQVLSKSLIATLSTPYVDLPDGKAKYAYGLKISTYRGMKLLEHSGSRSGYGSLIQMLPEHRVGVVILANLSGAKLPKTAETALQLMWPTEISPGGGR